MGGGLKMFCSKGGGGGGGGLILQRGTYIRIYPKILRHLRPRFRLLTEITVREACCEFTFMLNNIPVITSFCE